MTAPADPSVVLALDPAWEATGWAIVQRQELLAFGRADMKATWRWTRVRHTLDELLMLADGIAGERGARCRLAVERYQTKHRGVKGRGRNPTKTVRGGSELVGAIAAAPQLMTHDAWRYTWEIEPDAWRQWYGLRGHRRGLKAAAGRIAAGLHPTYRAHLDRDEGGDVAEAILIATGASRYEALAPAGPSRPVTSGVDRWG